MKKVNTGHRGAGVHLGLGALSHSVLAVETADDLNLLAPIPDAWRRGGTLKI